MSHCRLVVHCTNINIVVEHWTLNKVVTFINTFGWIFIHSFGIVSNKIGSWKQWGADPVSFPPSSNYKELFVVCTVASVAYLRGHDALPLRNERALGARACAEAALALVSLEPADETVVAAARALGTSGAAHAAFLQHRRPIQSYHK